MYAFILVVILVNFHTLVNTHAETLNNECNKILIEGEEVALRKLFNDFSELKNAINELKLSKEVHQEETAAHQKDLPYFDERFDAMPEKCLRKSVPKDCASATSCMKRSGIYKIQIDKHISEPFYVACDADTENGDWLLIQKRHDGSQDFYRNWQDYELGFGDIAGEFFIGLHKLHVLTNYNGPQELLIVMSDANGASATAKYDSFAIANATEFYKLKRVGRYKGNAGNSLALHVGMHFSTKDRDNDLHKNVNCAVTYTGAWWYQSCHHSNLNGKYGDNTHGKGINWKTFRGHTVSLPYVKMMIRRSRNI